MGSCLGIFKKQNLTKPSIPVVYFHNMYNQDNYVNNDTDNEGNRFVIYDDDNDTIWTDEYDELYYDEEYDDDEEYIDDYEDEDKDYISKYNEYDEVDTDEPIIYENVSPNLEINNSIPPGYNNPFFPNTNN